MGSYPNFLLSGNENTFSGHNYKADYKFKVTQGQKADGAIQLKEMRVMSDELENILETGYSILEDWYKLGKKKNLKIVSPYEKGSEPNV